ncbi:hypothetical protein DDZ18_05635 [Marinicauda salina]|uniref:Proteinase inhibitor I42 chagasin domain-containing protein n=1 Tax=Marinicauda salina TaxID=2135793 RepID=A0A2U2BT46_9PROT|nr:protease inhibitor I42 family protein [Marinicauda salina]PWE17178.1 hypothetical protein DDZ18_05635 [Marinicauda salina]
MHAPREYGCGFDRRFGGRVRISRVRLASAFILAGAAVSTACAAPGEQTAGTPGAGTVHAFSETDDGRRVELSTGAVFQVRLRATPGTGYGWTVSEPAPPELALLSDELEGPAEAAPGAEESHVFRFRAVEPGTAELRMVYRRPWEAGVEPLRTFSLHIEIED